MKKLQGQDLNLHSLVDEANALTIKLPCKLWILGLYHNSIPTLKSN